MLLGKLFQIDHTFLSFGVWNLRLHLIHDIVFLDAFQEAEKFIAQVEAKESTSDKIKKGAVLINLAPNELIDLNALEKRLSNGDITYIMDHSDELTSEQASELSKHKNCIIYPPIGYTTKEATIEKQEIFVGNIENFLQGSPTNKVN